MKIRIVAVGGKMPDWVQTGFQEYARRIPQEFGLQLIEVPLGQRSKSQPAERAVAAEGEAMLRAIPDGDR
ncbi:MAG: 23S rRNA (pseudouridine(1915)-N(3))-methyltransferase RlmH, partial [bacterium]